MNDPRDRVPHADVRPGQERFWIGLTTALVGGIGILTAIGVWLLEARRRLRHGADATARAIIERFRLEHVGSGVTIDREPTSLGQGRIPLVVRGIVTSEANRKRAIDVATDEAGRSLIPFDIIDRLTIDPTLRRLAG